VVSVFQDMANWALQASVHEILGGVKGGTGIKKGKNCADTE
jgi:hypothetical protein